jgi:hypothetical protein
MADIARPRGSTRRVSLTKAQRETQVGIELLSLCQTVTADGSLSVEEVQTIRDWLSKHTNSDLPAVSFLAPIAEKIVADGVVTHDDRHALFLAIEKVLPVDVREFSRTARRTLEQQQKEQHKLEAAAAKQSQRDEKQRNAPIDHFDFMVAGVRYEGRPAVIARHVRVPDYVFLSRDADNRYSRNAIKILTTHGYQIGFVPEEDAAELAPLLDSNHPYIARIKKILSGGSHDIPVVIADLYRHDSSVSSAVLPKQSSITASPPASKLQFVPKALIVVIAVLLLFALRNCIG